MEIKLAENIRSFRKERKLTQEQLAEVLGVTTGAVYKWEAGLSLPELNMITELADFFDTSVDVLLGYRIRDNSLSASVARINEYCRTMDFNALNEAEKLLKKYPNSFEAVYVSANVYLIFATGKKGRESAYRALELYEQASRLISQNTDPRISKQSVFGNMASAYLAAGEPEKGIELLKANNTNGLFSDDIGVTLALFMKNYGEAETYLSEGFLKGIGSLLNALSGYAFIYIGRGDIDSAKEVIELAEGFLRSLKKGTSVDFTDKIFVEFLVLKACVRLKRGHYEEAENILYEVKELAERFDSAPDYGIQTIRFVSVPKDASAHDLLGEKAEESIMAVIDHLDDRQLKELWKEVKENE